MPQCIPSYSRTNSGQEWWEKRCLFCCDPLLSVLWHFKKGGKGTQYRVSLHCTLKTSSWVVQNKKIGEFTFVQKKKKKKNIKSGSSARK